MDLAIKKAKEFGIGMVVCRRSNHYGIAGYYSMQALKHNLIVILWNWPSVEIFCEFYCFKGLSSTNTSPLCYPTRSKKRTFGTNPLTMAAPGLSGDSFVLVENICVKSTANI
jgi:LDH2 family malate/lactate/ureidoglycolate dehydrogenase